MTQAAPPAAQDSRPTPAPVVAINGVLCDPATASISIFDRGFLYGDGVFTVLRGRAGAALELEWHLEQLAADAEQLELAMPPRTLLVRSISEVLAAFGEAAARLRIVVTRGRGGVHARWRTIGGGSALIMAEGAPPARSEIRAAVVAEPRLPSSRTWAAKSLSYQSALWARERAAQLGAEEALRLFDDDSVGEGAVSNVFLVHREEVVTPPPIGIRPGVTRRRVLALCQTQGLVVTQRPIARTELESADELFVTSSIAGVVAVVALDGRPRRSGPITAQLRDRYERSLA